MAFALIAAAVYGFHAWYKGQNTSAVGANVLISLDKADRDYASLDFLSRMESALKVAHDKGQLNVLRPDRFQYMLEPLQDEKAQKQVWYVTGRCDPHDREQITSPDPTLIECAAAIDEARIKINRSFGRHLADAVLGAAYLKDEKAALYERKKAPLCRKVFSYARENAPEKYFETGVLLFYYSSCDEAAQRILFSRELDGAFKACLKSEDKDDQQKCMDGVAATADFDKVRALD